MNSSTNEGKTETTTRHFYFVIPTFNRGKTILRAIQSVRNAFDCLQSDLYDLTLVVVDDGSDDGTEALLENYWHVSGKSNPHVFLTVIRQSNQGVAAARNNALDYIFIHLKSRDAERSYISFLDSDDYIAPGYFAYAMGYLDSNSVVSFSLREGGAMRIIDGRSAAREMLRGHGGLGNRLYPLHIWATIRAPSEMEALEDTFCLVRAMAQVQNAVFIPYVGYIIVQEYPSLCRDQSRRPYRLLVAAESLIRNNNVLFLKRDTINLACIIFLSAYPRYRFGLSRDNDQKIRDISGRTFTRKFLFCFHAEGALKHFEKWVYILLGRHLYRKIFKIFMK